MDNEKQGITHNIANGGESSKFGHCSPLQTFSTVDRNALRKPPLAILPNVVRQLKKN
tara:strand:+ start:1163 stop:1333 length:171 start_codon:yes stop_codon:yes gene_type:complete